MQSVSRLRPTKMRMVVPGVNAEAVGIALFFAALIAAVIAAFTVHVRLLATQVCRERGEQATQLAAMRPQPHVASSGATATFAGQHGPAPRSEEDSFRRAA